jgi:hypothetical protein
VVRLRVAGKSRVGADGSSVHEEGCLADRDNCGETSRQSEQVH